MFLVQMKPLMAVGMICFIKQNNLLSMLTEQEHFTFNFEINKDVTLRRFIGPEQFKSLISQMVSVLGDRDFELKIMLLDKIEKHYLVLSTLIAYQWSQIQINRPLKFVSPEMDSPYDNDAQYGILNADPHQQSNERPAQQFSEMLRNYETKGIRGRHTDLFYAVD